MKALVTAALLFLSAAAVFSADNPKCRVCDQPVTGQFYFVKDKARGGQFEVCTNCINLESRCLSCSFPVKSGFTTLPDGRFLCTLCSPDAVVSDEETKKLCWETRESLDRLFARHLTFPQTNVVVTVVDRFTLDSLFKSPGFAQQCTSVYGATRSHPLGKHYVHTLSILSGLNKHRLEAVAAHEFTHAWLNENLTPERKAALSRDALEGFCELVAYDFMQVRDNEIEKINIKENPYTAGQLEAFLAAEAMHGFNAVVDWVKTGESAKLDPVDPDGVRFIHETASSPTGPPAYYSTAPPPPLPDKLRLKSISGVPGRRLAIINDRTFALKDQALLKLATTNVLIRCLEIRTNSVVIQFVESGAKQELLLPED
jgi:hypothetical protein